MSIADDRKIIEEYKLNPNQDTSLAYCNMVNNAIKRMEAYVRLAESVKYALWDPRAHDRVCCTGFECGCNGITRGQEEMYASLAALDAEETK